jgi:histidine decarboxylase
MNISTGAFTARYVVIPDDQRTGMNLTLADRKRLNQLLEDLAHYRETELGYPVAFDIDIKPLVPFLGYSLNNVGDPWHEAHYRINTREFEREVLSFFAALTHAPEDDWWGYVTNGGTEGNLYGMYLARELFPDGIVYFSRDSHYSVAKNLHFLGMRNIMIRSQPNGEMDYDDLRETIRIRRDAPPIIFANIGTTMTEGRDDIRLIQSILDDMAIDKRYIHSDAALCGGYAAFLDPPPAWNFADGADSISISGHKFFAMPIPCGIVLARKRFVDRVAHSVAYIGTRDTTISGSRSGFTVMGLWWAIRTLGMDGMRARLEQSIELARYAEKTFRQAGIDAKRNKNALTVVFPRPHEQVCDKWQLATAGDISHIVCMPHLRKEQIDALLEDIIASEQPEQGMTA